MVEGGSSPALTKRGSRRNDNVTRRMDKRLNLEVEERTDKVLLLSSSKEKFQYS